MKLTPSKSGNLIILVIISIFSWSFSLSQIPPGGFSLGDENQKGQIYISIPVEELENHPEIKNMLSVDYFNQGKVFAYSNLSTLQKIIERGIHYTPVKSPGIVDFDLNMKTWDDLQNKDLTDSWDFYPTYEAYVSLMNQFAADYPDLCEIHNIQDLPSGRSLLFAKISANVQESNSAPRFMYTATIHGDETTGFILMLRLIHHLLNNYGTDEQITYLLDNMEIWICPNENPDGTYTSNNNTVNGATRMNSNGWDLNRNYPNWVGGATGPLQQETMAMMELTDSINFVLSANLHGGIELVNYPWDSYLSSTETIADHEWWQLVSHEYADTARFYSPANYMDPQGGSFVDGVTHGGDWYVVYGSRQDYMNYYRNQREVTLELSNTKLLPPEQLPAHWNYNYRSLINYMHQALYGFQGTVTDLYSGEPIEAKIELVDHDIKNTFVFSELPNGRFSRPVLAGTYDIKVSAEGYNDYLLNGVSVENYEMINLDIQLSGENPFAPPSNLIANTSSNATVFLSWNNPVEEDIYDFYIPAGYKIYRNGEVIGQINNNEYFDEELAYGNYEYTVTAVYENPDGESHPSNIASVTLEEPVYFTISASAGNNGTIEPAGEIEIQQDHYQNFTITPNAGFVIDEVLVDGISVGALDSYSFMNVNENHTIHASFIEENETYSITFNVYDENQDPINEAIISLNDQDYQPGEYTISNLQAGSYEYMVSMEDFIPATGMIDIDQSDQIVDVTLEAEVSSVVTVNNQHPDIVIFPNPSQGRVTINSEMIIEKLVIADLTGRILMEQIPESDNFDINLNHIPSGVYLISSFHKSGQITSRIEVQKKKK